MSPAVPTVCEVSGTLHQIILGQSFCPLCGQVTSQLVVRTERLSPTANTLDTSSQRLSPIVNDDVDKTKPPPSRFSSHHVRTAEIARQRAVSKTQMQPKTKPLPSVFNRSNRQSINTLPTKPIRTTIYPVKRSYYHKTPLAFDRDLNRVYTEGEKQSEIILW